MIEQAILAVHIEVADYLNSKKGKTRPSCEALRSENPVHTFFYKKPHCRSPKKATWTLHFGQEKNISNWGKRLILSF